jgi:hypothetical protein
MGTVYSVIVDEFEQGLVSLSPLVLLSESKSESAKSRVAAVHAATLLLAATFEEFIRQMAREYAGQVIERAPDVSKVPDAMIETAWRRTFDAMARHKPRGDNKRAMLVAAAKSARPEVEALCAFIDGDKTQNILDRLIHNENNMRAGEINSLFKVSGASNICHAICQGADLKSYFEENDEGKVHGRLIIYIEQFFDVRNEIAHSLNSANSLSADTFRLYMDFFRAFAEDLRVFLDDEMV